MTESPDLTPPAPLSERRGGCTSRHPPLRSKRGAGGVRFLPLGALLSLTVGCHAPEAKKPTVVEVEPVAVAVAEAREQSLRRTIPASGTLNGTEDVILSPKVDGQVLAARFDLGDEVTPGTALVELDATEYELAAKAERSGVEVQAAQLAVSKAVVEQEKASLKKAQDDVKRLKGNTGSESEKGAAEAAVEVGKARVKAAEAGVQAAADTLEVKRLALAVAEQKVRDATLRVPAPPGWIADAKPPALVPPAYRYTVAAKMVSVGEMVRSFPGTNAYRLVVTHTLKLKLSIPEKHTPEVKLGQAVRVRVEAYSAPDDVFTGTVTRISPAVDTATRTFVVEVTVPNADGRLKAGGFATAEVVVGDTVGVTVPPTAVVVFAGVSKVFVAEGSKARAVLVEVGDRGPDWLEVKGNLKAGEKVITSGFTLLFDGAPISNR